MKELIQKIKEATTYNEAKSYLDFYENKKEN
jgi:hypothetical protein